MRNSSNLQLRVHFAPYSQYIQYEMNLRVNLSIFLIISLNISFLLGERVISDTGKIFLVSDPFLWAWVYNTIFLDPYNCKKLATDGHNIIVPTTACIKRCSSFGFDAACEAKVIWPRDCICINSNLLPVYPNYKKEGWEKLHKKEYDTTLRWEKFEPLHVFVGCEKTV